jgi:hypothetical protein
MSDCVLDWMKKNLPPEQWTRENYLQLTWLGTPPEEIGPELEAEMPEEFQLPENRSGWVGPFTEDNVIDISTRKAKHPGNGKKS